MKKILLASVVTGAAIAGLLLYIRSQRSGSGSYITDATSDAQQPFHSLIEDEEKKFNPALN